MIVTITNVPMDPRAKERKTKEKILNYPLTNH